LLPSPRAREIAKRAIAGWVREAQQGRIALAANDVQAVEEELLGWAREIVEAQLRQRSEAEVENYVRREVQSRLWAEVERLEHEYALRSARHAPSELAQQGRAVAAMLQVEDEPGYGGSENGDGQPFVVERPVERRGPRRASYLDTCAADAYGGRWSEFG